MSTSVSNYIDSKLDAMARGREQFERLFYFLEDEELLFIPEGEQWSAIECIEHINNVNEVYLPQLTKICQLENARERETLTRSGFQKWVGKKMAPLSSTGSKFPAPKSIQPRRLRNPDLKIAPQKVMENFISDFSQLEKIIRIIPHSKELSNERVQSVVPVVKIKALTAIEILVPHLLRHLEQAQRILEGGRNAKLEAEANKDPDIIYPTAQPKE